MNEPDRWDTPQIIKDTKNAVAYIVIWGSVLMMLIILFGGMICPVFLPWIFRRIDAIEAEYKRNTPPDGVYVDTTNILKWTFGIGLSIWCIISWLFFLYTQLWYKYS